MPKRSTWAEWWGMSCGAVVLDGILWKIVGDLWLLNNFVASPSCFESCQISSPVVCIMFLQGICDVQKYPLECRFPWNAPYGQGLVFYTHIRRHLFSVTTEWNSHFASLFRMYCTFLEFFPKRLPKFYFPSCIMEMAECSILVTISIIDVSLKNH